MVRKYDRQSLAKDVVRYVRDEHNYRNINLVRDDLASFLGVTCPMLTSIVHQELGTTFTDLVNKYRAYHAHRLIKTSADDVPLEDIAIRSGFSNRMTMHRAFLKVYGMSPGKIRKEKNNSNG